MLASCLPARPAHLSGAAAGRGCPRRGRRCPSLDQQGVQAVAGGTVDDGTWWPTHSRDLKKDYIYIYMYNDYTFEGGAVGGRDMERL